MSEVATTTSIPGASPRLLNEDLAPAKECTWKFFDLFAMWMSDIHSIGGYTFAAGLFFTGPGRLAGTNLGMNLTGIAGQKNGVGGQSGRRSLPAHRRSPAAVTQRSWTCRSTASRSSSTA